MRVKESPDNEMPGWVSRELSWILYNADMESEDVIIDKVVELDNNDATVQYHWTFCDGEGILHLHNNGH